MSQFKKLIIIFIVIVGAAFLAPHLSLAVDPGFSTVEGSLALSAKSPLAIATTIINFLFGFLGFIAVCLILWAGFIWMTSGGNEDKIAQAKKILINGVIGLIIILSAWGITYFVISKILSASDGSYNPSYCTDGARTSCQCGGEQVCVGNSWGLCVGSTCLPDIEDVSCDGNTVLSDCQADNNICGSEYLCDNTSCLCKPKGSLGQSCDATPGGQCNADNNLCGPYLKCDADSCLCVGPPVITGISPVGGFCVNDENRACNTDSDCLAGGVCNSSAPNGAANNFLTIYGYNFNSALKAEEQVLIRNNFDQAALGGLSSAWRAEVKNGAKAMVSAVAARSAAQSLLIHQEKDLVWPGNCNQTQCAAITGCTWNGTNKTCSFTAKDECKKTVPAVYSEGEGLCYPNADVNMSAKLYYDVTPLNLQIGATYSIQFYYKGKITSDLSLSFGDNQCLGYGSAGALKPEYSWNGSSISPTLTSGEDPCNPAYGHTCSEQSNTCCANALQNKCYVANEMTPILSGSYNDWKLYSYTLQYTPEMETWLNKSGQKKIEFVIGTSYASTGAGSDFYIDDFSVSKIPDIGQVTFLGANSSQEQLANYPRTLNPSCISSWTDRQIIIAIPSGAANGPIRVERENNLATNLDQTNDELGPKIPNFVKNTISRPGLCSISPTRGLLGEKVVYQGINLRSSEAYFGDYSNSYKGINSNFISDNLSGQTLAPSIMPGKTTTFVEGQVTGLNQKSNALVFIKDIDPEIGPYISSFYPVSGQVGQYVTILGRGFGNTRGGRQVLFGDKEASYDFPAVCTNSIWSDGQIVVKVPEGLGTGNFQLKVKLGETLLTSALLSPSTFEYNTTVPVKVGLCKIDPILGQVGSKVNLWGEYFGAAGSQISVVFNSNKSTSSPIIKDSQADKIETAVPADAVTGPVYLLKNSDKSNELNFNVGKCTKNDECSGDTPVCCANNTYKTGTCAASVVSCYFDIPNSVYETNFNTGYNSATSTVFDSCIGMATYFGGSCQTGQFCPNSPGKCSPFTPGAPEVLGDCGSATSACGALTYCKDNAASCTYNKAKDVCQVKVCQLENELSYSLTTKIDNKDVVTDYKGLLSCRAYKDKVSNKTYFLKQLKVNTTCPDNMITLEAGYCVDKLPLTTKPCSGNQVNVNGACIDIASILCEPCATDFKCIDNGAGNNLGTCESAKLCASGATCELNLNKYSCLKASKKSCDCCCTIGKDNECCAGLTCAGTCGSDTTEGDGGFGSCSGCAKPSGNIAEQDAACNCSTTTGKYCDTSKQAIGVCVDCAALDQTGCSLHSEKCCYDAVKKTCQGGDGTLLNGFCAYYDCGLVDTNGLFDKTKCNETAMITGQFLATSTCITNCAKNPKTACDLAAGDKTKCDLQNACCFDAQNNICTNGTEKLGDKTCARFDCLSGGTKCNNIASSTGAYLGSGACATACNKVSPGSSCASDKPSVCQTDICGDPYKCSTVSGGAPTDTSCGFCCCTPGTKLGSLTCLPDKGDCSGAVRGLFCGCTADNQCGSGDVQGCGFDTCCHARPNVLSTSPINDAVGVCRNSQIVISFNQPMKPDSLLSNVLLVEEKAYGSGVCADGVLAFNNNLVPKNNSLLARIYRQITTSWRNLFSGSNSAMAALPSENKLYCLTPTIINSQQTYLPNGATSTDVYLRPQKILSAETNYFVIVKGDKDLNSNLGVMSADKVGLKAENSPIDNNLKFGDTVFPKSYVFNFKTMVSSSVNKGLCTVDKVKVSPVSFLIKSAENDQSDDDYNQINSFDKKSDNDRLLLAQAYSEQGQLLQPVTSYFWKWQWEVKNNTVASIKDTIGLPADRKVVQANNGITDNSTEVKATVSMNGFSAAQGCKAGSCVCVDENCSNNCCNITSDGDGANGSAEMYVFICVNPWPMEKNGLWTPWADISFDKDGQPVINHNYKFYYCRDAGEPGTFDDLPAINDAALVLGAKAHFCSQGGAVCDVPGAACGPNNSGVCIWSVLKESYFFRTALPQSGEITQASDTGLGGQVELKWYSPADLVSSYKIYYGPVTGNSSASIVPVTLQQAACVKSASQYTCTYLINKLVDGQKYNFMVSSISDKKTESPLFGGKEVIPSDKTAPTAPQGVTATTIGTSLKVSWRANTDDAVYYRIYHALKSGLYNTSVDSLNKATSTTFNLSDYATGNHIFAVTALDKNNNESGKSVEYLMCQAGSYKSGNSCLSCTAGYYCPINSNRIYCGTGKTSPIGSSSITDCFVGGSGN